MSSTKFFANYFLIALISLHDLRHIADGIPTLKSSLNITKTDAPPTEKPTGRNPRLFGKFALVAGLGLPDLTPSPIKRNDLLYERPPTPLSLTSYNLPQARWGPYIAAIYEPSPVLTYLRDQLSYLAAVLNPFNWFENSPINTGSSSGENSATQIVQPDTNQDDVLLLVQDRENEIPNEDRNLILEKVQTKKESDNYIEQTLQNTMTTVSSESIKTSHPVTMKNNVDKTTDLLAEETTIKLFEELSTDEEDSRKEGYNFKKDGIQNRQATNTTNTTPVTSATVTIDNITTTEMVTSTISMTNNNSTANTTNQTLYPTNTTNQPFYPSYNNSYPQNNNEYYYDGYPQNVSHVEFTTPAAMKTVVTAHHQVFDNINRFLQQYPTTYYGSYEPQPHSAVDYYNNRFEQLPPIVNNYYDRSKEFSSSNDNNYDTNGFKPSFSLYHK